MSIPSNIEERGRARSKQLLKHATDEEASQINYINARFEGTAGPPFPDGDAPDAGDSAMLGSRRRDICTAIERRIKTNGGSNRAAAS